MLVIALVGAGLYHAAVPVSTEPAAKPEPRPGLPLLSQPDASGGSGFFVEKPGQREMPVLYITNLERDTMTLILRSREGHVYQAISSNGNRVSLQVPAGDYAVQVFSSSPYVQPNYGDATFHRYKEYEANFVDTNDAEPLHLGD
jgi:hypothetical protein